MNSLSSPPSQRTFTNSGHSRKSHVRRESSGHLCTACDQCYRCKVRCSGERPSCERCRLAGSACTYSTGKPLGKPKGSKNKVQRNKTSPDLESRQTVPAESQPSTSTPPKSPLKRPNEDALPSPKRTASETSILRGRSHQTGAQFFSPKMDIPEMPSLQVVPRHEDSALVCGLPYYTESAHHESTLQQTLEHPTPGGVEDVFASASLNLEMDDFQWFSTTPTGIGIDLSIPHESISGISSSHQSGPPSILAIDQQNSTLDSSLSPSVFGGRSRGQPCLCDPLSLGIISELHTLQLSYSPLDAALILARRGLTTVSSYLSCSSCLNHLGGSQSLFLACVLILQQVFACYITLKVQGNKLLSNPEGSGSSNCSSVSIGEFEVEGEESTHVLLDAIVRAEMERGKGVIGQLAERVGDGKEKMAGVLLQSLREEIGGVC